MDSKLKERIRAVKDECQYGMDAGKALYLLRAILADLDAPTPAKEPVHTSCAGCGELMNGCPGANDVFLRECWTPAQPKPPAPDDISKGAWFGHTVAGVVVWTQDSDTWDGDISAIIVDGKKFVPEPEQPQDISEEAALVRRLAAWSRSKAGVDGLDILIALYAEAERLCPATKGET